MMIRTRMLITVSVLALAVGLTGCLTGNDDELVKKSEELNGDTVVNKSISSEEADEIYDSSKAVNYALDQALGKEWNDFFVDFTYSGGNCTNFVSQVILAGMSGEIEVNDVYDARVNFLADYNDNTALYKWYYYSENDISGAWKGAHELYKYAENNKPSYKGMHFKFITKDSPTQALQFSEIQLGDIIFADWTGDNEIEHTMVVTDKTYNTYNGIYVSYHNGGDYDAARNNSLSNINSLNTVFYVYRPTFYSNSGY